MGWDFKERRDFDRIPIPATANVFAHDESGNHLGRVRTLGRGGFLLVTDRRFPPGDIQIFTIVAEHCDVRRRVEAEQRYTSPDGHVGFEFKGVDPETTLKIATLMERYRSSSDQ